VMGSLLAYMVEGRWHWRVLRTVLLMGSGAARAGRMPGALRAGLGERLCRTTRPTPLDEKVDEAPYGAGMTSSSPTRRMRPRSVKLLARMMASSVVPYCCAILFRVSP
jgi:hypothetical protein